MLKDDVDEFEKVVGQLGGLHSELSGLVKKSPNEAVNKFKLKFINALFVRVNTLLGPTYKPFDDFDTFDDDDLPSNSDVAFMTSQYLEAAEKMRGDNIHNVHGSWRWTIEGDATTVIRTSPPLKTVNRK